MYYGLDMRRNPGKAMCSARRSSNYRYMLFAALIIIAAVSSYYIINSSISHGRDSGLHAAAPDVHVHNLNLSDVVSILPGSQYVAVMQGNFSTFILQLQDEGYLGSSASLFELNVQKQYNGTRFPAVIMSDVLIMSNQTITNQSLRSMFFSNNADQINGSITYKLEYPNGSIRDIRIYTIYSAAVFNRTIAKMLNISNTHMPDFQYASIFEYNSAIGAVYSNGYVKSQNFSNVSISLAEILVRKLAS